MCRFACLPWPSVAAARCFFELKPADALLVDALLRASPRLYLCTQADYAGLHTQHTALALKSGLSWPWRTVCSCVTHEAVRNSACSCLP